MQAWRDQRLLFLDNDPGFYRQIEKELDGPNHISVHGVDIRVDVLTRQQDAINEVLRGDVIMMMVCSPYYQELCGEPGSKGDLIEYNIHGICLLTGIPLIIYDRMTRYEYVLGYRMQVEDSKQVKSMMESLKDVLGHAIRKNDDASNRPA